MQITNCPTLGQLSQGRDNNLNLIRLLAAIGVLVSHATPLVTGSGAPLKSLFGINLGAICVIIFFAISGFLVSQSLARARTLVDWTAARAMRILPGLFVAVSLTALVLGPLATDLPLGQYFADPAVPGYILRNATVLNQQLNLPGVFSDAPLYPTVNGSIWTLYAELLCYFAVLAAGLLGWHRRNFALMVAVGAFVAFYGWATLTGAKYDWNYFNHGAVKYGLAFAIGTAFCLMKSRLILSFPLAAALTLIWVALRNSPADIEVLTLVIAYWTFLLAYRPAGVIRRYNRLGDYSYGLYVYAWPIQQTLIDLNLTTTPMENIALALPVTLALAVASWHLIERPALGLRHLIGRSLSGSTRNHPNSVSLNSR